jgi:predicted DNA-binding transcriptional regulator AlpA
MNTTPEKSLMGSGNCSHLLRIGTVAALTTMSRSCIRLWVAQGRFPRPIALSSTMKVWRSSDVLDWIDKQLDGIERGDYSNREAGRPAVARAKGRLK